MAKYTNKVFYKSSASMDELPNESIDLIITSPPYFNIKNYSKDGYQIVEHSIHATNEIGNTLSYDEYISDLLVVWKECERVLSPNGKMCINVPLMPMRKKEFSTHHNRHIFDLQSDIQYSILHSTHLYLMDLYIWNRTNSSKRLMFGSFPYPRNFYAQNTSEFITIFVKDGNVTHIPSNKQKQESRLTQEEWVNYTKQIWDIPIPNKIDKAYGKHPAIMPEEIVRRCVKMFSFVGDIVLDPFAGSGTTLKVAKELNRHYVGYELYENYKTIIETKLSDENRLLV